MTTGTYRQHRNTQCIHCGHIGFSDAFPDEPVRHPSVCCHCRAAGRTMPAPDPESPARARVGVSKNPTATPAGVDDSARIQWADQMVTAHGFTVEQFARAMVRAFADDLRVKQLSNGEYIVHHAGVTHGYRVTRERCDCPAGQAGVPCKHRAVLIAHLDIRMPHVERQWRKLHADRPAVATAPEVA